MGEVAETTDAQGPSLGPATKTDRPCLVCGYNLRGLGEEPRCPECGLRHVPERFRQQVWNLVDSGKWFFSGMFTPFHKRLPGWWWSLDRERDVQMSFRAVVRNLLLAAIIIYAAAAGFDSIVVEVTEVLTAYYPDGTTNSQVWQRSHRGLFHRHDCEQNRSFTGDAQSYAIRSSARIDFCRTSTFVGPAGLVFLLACLIWLCPSGIGLWTQIRKGLPAFARAPRTILAATNLESHRVIYSAILAVVWMIIELILRWHMGNGNSLEDIGFTILSAALVYPLATLNWIGPLRSDFTGQLVRSRRHAIRVYLMYAFVAPAILFITICAAIDALSSY